MASITAINPENYRNPDGSLRFHELEAAQTKAANQPIPDNVPGYQPGMIGYQKTTDGAWVQTGWAEGKAPNVKPASSPYMEVAAAPPDQTVEVGGSGYQPSPIRSFQSEIDAGSSAQKQARILALQRARDTALSSLKAEGATIEPQYYAQRNAAGAASEIGKMNFAEYMAARGTQNSGASAQAEISRQGALQGQVGALNQQQQAANNDIARRTTDTNTSYGTGVAQSDYEINAQTAMARIAELQRVQQLQIQSDQFGANYGLSEAGITGYLNGGRTLAGQQLDSQNIRADRDYDFNVLNSNRDYGLRVADQDFTAMRAKVGDTQWQTMYDLGVRTSAEAASYQAKRDTVIDEQWVKTFGLQEARSVVDLQIAEIDLQIKKAIADPNSVANQAEKVALQYAQQQLATARETAKYAPALAAAQVNQVKAATASSFASARASNAAVNNIAIDNAYRATQATSAAGTTEQNRLMNIWQAMGTAPAGITGVTPGTAWYEKPSTTAPKPVAPANLLQLANDFNTAIQGKELNGSIVGQMSSIAAIQMIDQMVVSGQISERESLVLAQSIPAVKAYLDAQNAKGASQVRY